MPEFTYTVRDKTGHEVTGKLEADDSDVLAGRLRQMGYFVVSIEEVKASLGKKEIYLFGSGIKKHDVVIFTRQFATMITAGLPLIKALDILSEQTESKPLAQIITDVQKEVQTGKSLSAAMAEHDTVFNKLYINMVKAGETGGMLDDVLLRLADQLEREENIRKKVKSAMTYPVAVLALTIVILTAMMMFVVPSFVKMFEDVGGELPKFTQMEVSVSHFIAGPGGLFILVFAVVFFLAFRQFKATEKGSYIVDSIRLKLPVFGILTHKQAMSRFARTLGTLLASGVPILGSLEITGEATGNEVVGRILDDVRNHVKEGEAMHVTLAQYEIFPPLVTQMIAIGEETGSLDTMLGKVSDFYDAEVDATVESLTSLLEPILMMFLGGTVGVVVIGLYLPMFSIIQQIK